MYAHILSAALYKLGQGKRGSMCGELTSTRSTQNITSQSTLLPSTYLIQWTQPTRLPTTRNAEQYVEPFYQY